MPSSAERRLERRKHPLRREGRRPTAARAAGAGTSQRRASSRPIPSRARKAGRPRPRRDSRSARERRGTGRPVRVERGTPKRAVELEVACRRRARNGGWVALVRLQVIGLSCSLQELAARLLELLAAPAVGLVRERRPRHAQRNPLAVDLDLQLGLERGERSSYSRVRSPRCASQAKRQSSRTRGEPSPAGRELARRLERSSASAWRS